jgi:hypothetical protein
VARPAVGATYGVPVSCFPEVALDKLHVALLVRLVPDGDDVTGKTIVGGLIARGNSRAGPVRSHKENQSSANRKFVEQE